MKTRTITSFALLAGFTLTACRDELARPELDQPRSAVMAADENRRRVANEDRTDAADNSIAGLIGRLESVDRVLDVLEMRMDIINASVGPRPDDSAPAFRKVLVEIQGKAQYLYDVVAFLMDCEGDRPPRIAASGATVTETDRTDSDDTSSEGLLGRLGSVANVLGALAKRMDDIEAASADTCLLYTGGETWSPAAGFGALAAIQLGAMHVVQLADDILTNLAL